MPLNVKNEKAHQYAKKLAELTGRSITDAVTEALRSALEKAQIAEKGKKHHLVEELDEISLYCSSRPVLDNRSADEILGYNDKGVPE